MNATLRRSSRILFVGWPLASSFQWREGYAYSEFRIGCSKKMGSILRQVDLLNAPSPAIIFLLGRSYVWIVWLHGDIMGHAR